MCCEFLRGFRIVPVLIFRSWILNKIWIIDLSFFCLGRYFKEFIEVIPFFKRSSFKLRCETVIGIVLCYSRQACPVLCHLCKINNGISRIHIYQFTLNFYTPVSGCGCGFGFEQKQILWKKKARIGAFAYPYSISLLFNFSKGWFSLATKAESET